MPTNEQRRATAKRKLERQLERRAAAERRRRLYTIIASAVVVLAVIAGVAVFFITRKDSDSTTTAASTPPSSSSAATTEPAPAAEGQLPAFKPPADLGADCQYPTAQAASKPNKPPRTGKVPTDPAQVSVSMATDQGNIGIQLDNAKAPCTVNSFASLAQQNYFNDTPCHRLTTSPGLSVLQCGDPTGSGSGGPGYEFADEIVSSLTFSTRGVLAMANSGPDTNGSQFFITFASASFLDGDYTIFGHVIEGDAVLDAIQRGEPPASPTRIQSVQILQR